MDENNHILKGINMLPPKGEILYPFVVQEMVYELTQSRLLNNSAKSEGFLFDNIYDPDVTKPNNIFLIMSKDWDTLKASQRPAVIISRSDVQIERPTIGQTYPVQDPAESIQYYFSINSMVVTISVLARPVAFVEQLAEYIKRYFMAYEPHIRCKFKLRKFRLGRVSRPLIHKEARDNFMINMPIEIMWDEIVGVKGDDLKLKVVDTKLK